MIETFKGASLEARDLYLGTKVIELKEPPTPLEFMRFVSCRQPFIIKRGCKHWPALKKWKRNQDWKSLMADSKVEVAIVPDGYADAIKVHHGRRVFTLPYEKTMLFSKAIDFMTSPSYCEQNNVYYIQSQNDNLKSLPLLNADIDDHVSWATEAFNSQPDAVNIWVGKKKSVTSLHKDNYENIYGVVRGKKIFTLYPPIDTPFMKYEEFDVFRYDENMKLKPENYKTFWCEVSDDAPEPIVMVIEEGDLAYIPSLFYHMVEQEEDEDGLCVAVNYWYDMFYGESWCFMNLLRALTTTSKA